MSIHFTLNGETLDAGDVDPNTTLLDFLRDRGLTGTKEGCAEGECGACAVVLRVPGAEGGSRFVPVNSCLLLVGSVAGQEVWSVEGVKQSGTLHPVQRAMVEYGGSQCGYCTPGFVMSMFAEYYREGRDGFDPESIGGNLCRCTGYRPIRDAMRSMGLPLADDPFAGRLAQTAPAPAPVDHQTDAGRRFLRPTTLDGLWDALEAHPDARLVNGGTDLVVEINQRHARHETLLALDGVAELATLEEGDDAIVIGAGVTLSTLEHELGETLPMFGELLPLFSSRLIRNRATLGGNLMNASPIGDSPPVLLALDAEVVLARRGATRTVPLSEFFTGYRQTVCEPGEILRSVRVPRPLPSHQRFYKVSKRVMDDISTVAAGFALWEEGGVVTKARLAYGGVAATPVRATEAEAALVGRPFDAAAVSAAEPLLAKAFTPMTDHRGSDRYRQAMVTSLLHKLRADRAQEAAS